MSSVLFAPAFAVNEKYKTPILTVEKNFRDMFSLDGSIDFIYRMEMPKRPRVQPLAVALRKARAVRGWTQAEAAARIGVAQPTYCVWESGRVRPRQLRWSRIRQVLGVRPGMCG